MTIRSVLLALLLVCLGCGEDDGADPFGTLTLSGPDTAEVGTTFTPISKESESFGNVSQIVRWYLDPEPNEFRVLQLTINTNDGNADVAGVVLALPQQGTQFGRLWLGGRQPDQVDVDLEDRSVTFDNYVLEGVGGFEPLVPITLNGTLTW